MSSMSYRTPGRAYPLPAQNAGDCLDQLAALARPDDQSALALAISAIDLGAPASMVRSVLLGYFAAVHPDPDEALS